MKELDHSNVTPRKIWYKKWWVLILLALFLLFAFMLSVIGFFIFDVLKTDYLNDTSTSIPVEELNKYIKGTDNNYWLGTNKPAITIVEFSDFACPYCKETFPKIREISQKYKNEVKIIFRDYPIISPQSEYLALAGRCAGEQGLFWVMHDKLFLNQGISETEEIFDLASQIGVDQNRFKTCFNNENHSEDIQRDYDDGVRLGITGTPTWFINGTRIEGNIPYNVFIDIIENILKNNITNL